MEEAALSSRLNTQEKLLISQAVYKLGAVNWEKISALLENHPVIEGRPKEWFDATTVEAYYVGLMTEIGQNVPAQDGARERAKVHLRLAQTFYLARLQELKSSIEEYEQNFSKLMTEITAIKSGSMDKVLKDEIRGVLARKYGKKLLDSWVPDEDAIKEAVEAGPPMDEELKQVDTAAVAEVEEVPAAEDFVAVEEEAKVSEVPIEETQEPAKEEVQEAEDVTMKEPSASPTKPVTPAPQAAEASSPADKDESAVSPASDLSSVPGSPVKSRAGRGASKRKASTQPRGAPVSKRSTKRRNTATPAVEEETATEEPEVEQEQEEAEAIELVPETPAPVEDDLPKRGRRTTKRESVVRRPSTRKATSPETSTRHSSPINPKRALSASSARSNSATPAAEGRPRRGRKGRGMRDEVVSKLAREQSAAEDSAREDEEETPKPVEAEIDEEEPEAELAEETGKEEEEEEEEGDAEKEEEEEEERPATRTSRRTKSTAAPVEKDEGEEQEDEEEDKLPTRASRRGKDVETPVPEKAKEAEKKSTRRSSARGGKLFPTLHESPLDGVVAPAEEEEKPEIKEEPKGKAIQRPRASSPREFKATRTMLNNLLDQISSHKHGSMFANPVKPNDAPGYEDVIKRPMSIKTVRSRIREGQITTIDEFERDVMLIFANATMYNSRGSGVYDMAVEMMKDAEVHIKHLKNVQLQHLNRG